MPALPRAILDENSRLDILVVRADVAAPLAESLAGCGHRIEIAADGARAVEALDNRCFDAVIAAVEPAAGDGLGLLRFLRRAAPATAAILVSARGSIGEAVAATRAGATYLAAPVAPEELLLAVGEIAERRRAAAATAAADLDGDLLVGRSPAMAQLKRNLAVVARSDGAVLVCGESGTGKELVARMIHRASARRDKPLVTVNCAAFPDTLLEAELFGHERGAFTGATARRAGRFETAAGGTLFLDEIGEMPLVAQAKLLRVLEVGTFERLGSNVTLRPDVRIVSATNRDLEKLVAQGRFREDLFYRVKLFRVAVPPLRARAGDLALLVEHFCHKYARPDAPRPTLSARAWAVLRDHDFPGNVRELEHAVRHAMAFADGGEVQVEHLPDEIAGDPRAELPPGDLPLGARGVRPLGSAVIEFEHEYVLRALERTDGNRSLAASLLGISRKSLWAKLKRYQAPRPRLAMVRP